MGDWSRLPCIPSMHVSRFDRQLLARGSLRRLSLKRGAYKSGSPVMYPNPTTVLPQFLYTRLLEPYGSACITPHSNISSGSCIMKVAYKSAPLCDKKSRDSS